MDEDHKMVVLRFSTDAMNNVVTDAEVDGADGCLKKVRVLMHIGADVLLLNDVLLELEDDDHDVVYDHDVVSPLCFKVVMNKLMRFQME